MISGSALFAIANLGRIRNYGPTQAYHIKELLSLVYHILAICQYPTVKQLLTVLGAVIPTLLCHSRESGNPEYADKILDSRFRGNDIKHVKSNTRKIAQKIGK
ncbi:MAG: hypothetical protein A3G52_01240 [Candidatus Taylorbacteria bacterium RIFCSPLOWO2_12_FULL_43_20]|uniref:Uncharacterized protein n=1 Tax=Candidatus Taylorbacteria bacterium RIFCSPLOWO2_12_FULL_43_20 TaxID=1802332 RepID=A0A1G2P5F8_9BACT|nr:MAG: hypothetical protein A2825_00635 [Candidatus Taylorbacteria bacterium RIFCSPHIGHO2_01_FULL_43_120]OHA22318.1 MAG: hypothetical protein A3B98_04360 [Candidatus Taylorbacteria bacterium RIFCSPHIGHO2_02_FULL_43_55]OHA30444.1 MAG: hypothetical protein A3B09_04385 [Candidatus Taylorbacteria bacterium RIFCSPLOWO2_01_FULL_43_83]OHA39526.1 MAG: hypothetical protein A3H58_02620 [Candidatus Taylorbacteria bacterium RIFCSPLOWO2_02_FULL_43_22b]OHA42862.1 MAG: hypothetical protein A3G52_01240 [Candi